MKNRQFSLSDIPLSQSTNDFGTEGYVQGLVRFISHAATPITIALQGEWGSGKTSLMNRLYNELCGPDKNFIGININTWEYSMLASPEETVLKIISELIHSLSKDDPNASSKIKTYFKGFLNAAYRFGREFGKGVVPGAGLVVEALGVPSDLPGTSNESSNVSLADLKQALSDAIANSMSERSKEGVIIFVDDLDRLNPPLAVQILELLKNIFTLDHCIFILAIDYEVVVKGLEPKFGKLSDSNEREFRSFFDKIIQVPFSLPVNNYKPMNFVLDSLESIGFITHTERKLPYIAKSIERIVVSSVGKNPRSIKRLINTLSLLDCIALCAAKEQYTMTLEHKLINFAIVAMQVCYPKIYDLLTLNPMFDKWDETIATKLNLHLEQDTINEINGEIILDALCVKDVFLNRHHKEILALFKIIYDNAENIRNEEPAKVIKDILDRSSITNVTASAEVEELDRKAFIYKIHSNVWQYVSSVIPELRSQFKRNTGNGGYFIYLPDDSYYEIVFQPSQNEEKTKVTLRVFLEIWNHSPERLNGSAAETILNDDAVKASIATFNDTVSRLTKKGLIESHTWEDAGPFNNYIDELKCRRDEMQNSNCMSLNVDYYLNLASAADYEDPTIIKAIGDLILASYDLNSKALTVS